LLKRDQADDLTGTEATAYAERDLARPTGGKPNDQITCRMVSGDGSDNLIFQSEFSWSLTDPNGTCAHSLARSLSVLESEPC
jgi:hypothetical protein